MNRQQQPAAPAGRGGIRPGHLLVLGVLVAATATLVVTRGTGAINMVSVAVAVATAGLVAVAVFRTLAPLASVDEGEQTDMAGGRTRAALEREKMLVLRSIKDIEFDRAMKKISDTDYQEMLTRLRARAAGLMRQLDGSAGYRALIDRDLVKLTGVGVSVPAAPPSAVVPVPLPGECPACGIQNDRDARFCKGCGGRIGASS